MQTQTGEVEVDSKWTGVNKVNRPITKGLLKQLPMNNYRGFHLLTILTTSGKVSMTKSSTLDGVRVVSNLDCPWVTKIRKNGIENFSLTASLHPIHQHRRMCIDLFLIYHTTEGKLLVHSWEVFSCLPLLIMLLSLVFLLERSLISRFGS